MTSKFNRRKFVKSSAAWGTAILAGRDAIGQAETRGKKRSPNEEIRTAIIGIRNQGQNHIRYQSGLKDVRIVTLCDVDERLFADRVKQVPHATPKTVTDLRRVLDDKDIDCVTIAMPNHWHALATIWACQAGKDVYVEKPATYCIAEGRKMIDAAQRYNRVVQVGTHLRAQSGRQQAVKLLRDGVIGDLYMARAYFSQIRQGIGQLNDGPVPRGVNYDQWLGPAAKSPFNPNRFHYEWHWHWDYGNGEIGNNGPHLIDIVIDGLDKQEELPTRVASQGGRYVWNDQGQTPNTHTTSYQYADGMLVTFEVRDLASNKEAGMTSGVVFYGSKGYLTLTLKGEFHTVVDGQPGPSGKGSGAHVELCQNFYDVVRSRNQEDLLAPLKYGNTGAALCHLGNISYRLGRSVDFDPKTESFPHDSDACALLSRRYREPFVLPKHV